MWTLDQFIMQALAVAAGLVFLLLFAGLLAGILVAVLSAVEGARFRKRARECAERDARIAANRERAALEFRRRDAVPGVYGPNGRGGAA